MALKPEKLGDFQAALAAHCDEDRILQIASSIRSPENLKAILGTRDAPEMLVARFAQRIKEIKPSELSPYCRARAAFLQGKRDLARREAEEAVALGDNEAHLILAELDVETSPQSASRHLDTLIVEEKPPSRTWALLSRIAAGGCEPLLQSMTRDFVVEGKPPSRTWALLQRIAAGGCEPLLQSMTRDFVVRASITAEDPGEKKCFEAYSAILDDDVPGALRCFDQAADGGSVRGMVELLCFLREGGDIGAYLAALHKSARLGMTVNYLTLGKTLSRMERYCESFTALMRGYRAGHLVALVAMVLPAAEDASINAQWRSLIALEKARGAEEAYIAEAFMAFVVGNAGTVQDIVAQAARKHIVLDIGQLFAISGGAKGALALAPYFRSRAQEDESIHFLLFYCAILAGDIPSFIRSSTILKANFEIARAFDHAMVLYKANMIDQASQTLTNCISKAVAHLHIPEELVRKIALAFLADIRVQ